MQRLLLVFAAVASTAHAATFLQYASQRGQYIGAGGQATVTTTGNTFTASRHGAGVQVATQGASNWTISLDPPTGQQLAAGSYENTWYADATHGEIRLAWEGHECPVPWGSFTVLEVAYDASQNVARFAADLKVHCDDDEPAVFAGIRFNSDIAYAAPSTDYAAPAFIQWVSQPGDPVKHGTSGILTRADGWFSMRNDPGATGQVELRAYNDGPLNFFTVSLAPSRDHLLVPGTYENARAMPYFPSAGPGMDVHENYGSCHNAQGLGGRFVVYEVEYSPRGTLTKLAADFEQHCEQSTGGLYGAVRLNSTLPYTPPAVDTLPASIGPLTSSFVMVSRGGSGQGPAFEVLDPSFRPVPGVRLRYQSDYCGSLSAGPSPEAVTDANGIAQFPGAFIAPSAGSGTTYCAVEVSAPGTGLSHFLIVFVVVTPSAFTMDPLPGPTIEVDAGKPFRVGVHATLPDLDLEGYEATFSVTGAAPGAGPASLGSSATFASNETAYVDGVGGAVSGTYAIVVSVGGASRTITVNQRGSSGSAAPPAGNGRDMWWAPAENGWGMSLVQHGDTLFGALYIYDAAGKPTWLVMPGGAWDSLHTVYTGSLYTPSGAPFFAFDTTRIVVGPAKGSVAITFQDASNAIIDYTIGGITGRKLVTRQVFAPGPPAVPDHSDLWWGGASQSGWGLTIVQQAATLFGVWYTYDANGAATWYVMPGGAWTSDTTYEGRVYRTTGSRWVGADYNPASVVVFDVGTYRIRFSGDGASFDYVIDGHSGTNALVREPF